MYSWREYGSQLELLIEDESPGAVLTEALVALGDVLSETRGGEAVTHDMRVEAPDLSALLAGWLKELIHLAETDGFIPERVVRMEIADSSVEATVGGERSVPKRLIRAVAYSGLELEREDGTWRARVVVDLQ